MDGRRRSDSFVGRNSSNKQSSSSSSTGSQRVKYYNTMMSSNSSSGSASDYFASNEILKRSNSYNALGQYEITARAHSLMKELRRGMSDDTGDGDGEEEQEESSTCSSERGGGGDARSSNSVESEEEEDCSPSTTPRKAREGQEEVPDLTIGVAATVSSSESYSTFNGGNGGGCTIEFEQDGAIFFSNNNVAPAVTPEPLRTGSNNNINNSGERQEEDEDDAEVVPDSMKKLFSDAESFLQSALAAPTTEGGSTSKAVASSDDTYCEDYIKSPLRDKPLWHNNQSHNQSGGQSRIQRQTSEEEAREFANMTSVLQYYHETDQESNNRRFATALSAAPATTTPLELPNGGADNQERKGISQRTRANGVCIIVTLILFVACATVLGLFFSGMLKTDNNNDSDINGDSSIISPTTTPSTETEMLASASPSSMPSEESIIPIILRPTVSPTPIASPINNFNASPSFSPVQTPVKTPSSMPTTKQSAMPPPPSSHPTTTTTAQWPPTSTSPSTCHPVEIRIVFDNTPFGTGYTLKNATQITSMFDEFFVPSPDDDSLASQTYTQMLCVEAGSYVFTMYDYMGEGLCCADGAGSYLVTMSDNNGTISLAEGGEFGYKEETFFEIPATNDGEGRRL